jgi:hypothetical protein
MRKDCRASAEISALSVDGIIGRNFQTERGENRLQLDIYASVQFLHQTG